MSAMYLAIVPERRQSFIMIRMEMREKMIKSILWERFAEVKVIYHDVGICYQSSHSYKTLIFGLNMV